MTDVTPELCTICYDNYSDKDKVFTFKCSHSYHYDCIKKLFSYKNNPSEIKCPYCRENIITTVLVENV